MQDSQPETHLAGTSGGHPKDSGSDDHAEDVVKAIYEFAEQQLVDGKTPGDVEALLIARKLDAQSAVAVVSELVDNQVRRQRRIAGKNIRYGLFWAAGGLIVTLATQEAIIAWGAIVFGGLQFLKGVYQLVTSDA